MGPHQTSSRLLMFFVYSKCSCDPQVLKAKRGHMCEQEQLASDLDRALSLSQLGSLGVSHKLPSNAKVERSKGKSGEVRVKERSERSSVKGPKHKTAGKSCASEMLQKLKSQKKRSLFSPGRSELSSGSNSEYLSTQMGTDLGYFLHKKHLFNVPLFIYIVRMFLHDAKHLDDDFISSEHI